jgi:hypothetical protein
VVARYSWRYSSWKYRNQNPILFDRKALTEALTWCYEHCPDALNRVLKKNKWGDYSPLRWQKCDRKNGDTCASIRTYWATLYSYQARWGFPRTSWSLPSTADYREGTLNSRRALRTEEVHDEKICQNKILIQTPEDIERIIDKKIFGTRRGDNQYYQEAHYGGPSDLLVRLMPLLIQKGVLEDRNE